MSYIIIRLIKYQFIIVVSLLLFTACTSKYPKNDQRKANQSETNTEHVYLSAMIHKMSADKNPLNHINSIRSYALENFNSLTNEELKLIQNSNPKIYKSSTALEYCFVWFLSNNGGCLEVVATPPPTCTPVAVFRRDRVYFP
jgi:hypothetical protein